MLSREAVRQKLIGWGIPEPTDEQISDYLAQINKEVKSAEEKAEKYKQDSVRANDLAKELEELKTANLSDAEKSQKVVEDANKRIAELESTVKTMTLMNQLAEVGITGDDAQALFGEDGSLNVSKLGEIITGREKSAVANFEKEALMKTPNPEGGKPEEDKKDPIVDDAVKRITAENKADVEAGKIVDLYK